MAITPPIAIEVDLVVRFRDPNDIHPDTERVVGTVSLSIPVTFGVRS